MITTSYPYEIYNMLKMHYLVITDVITKKLNMLYCVPSAHRGYAVCREHFNIVLSKFGNIGHHRSSAGNTFVHQAYFRPTNHLTKNRPDLGRDGPLHVQKDFRTMPCRFEYVRE